MVCEFRRAVLPSSDVVQCAALVALGVELVVEKQRVLETLGLSVHAVPVQLTRVVTQDDLGSAAFVQ